jgi:predicted phosphodiesterase
MSERIIVLSDLHSNGRALRAALMRAESLGYDRIIVLGDLLTYGIDHDEVLDLVATLQVTRGAKVLLGNHDQLYLELMQGRRAYYDGLPSWLKETVDYTLERLDKLSFQQRIHWDIEHSEGPWLLAHANPWGAPDWRYLYTTDDAREAAATLRERGFVGGVFGHTHRRQAFRFADGEHEPSTLGDRWSVNEQDAHTIIINPGSVGQPRHSDRRSTFLRLERRDGRAHGWVEEIEYDVDAHVRALRESSMSEATRDKLCRFFESVS